MNYGKMKQYFMVTCSLVLCIHLVSGALPEPASCELDHSGTSFQTCIQNDLKLHKLDVVGVLNLCNAQFSFIAFNILI